MTGAPPMTCPPALIIRLGVLCFFLMNSVLAAPEPPTPPAAIPPGPGTTLTWEDCVRLALKDNPDLQASREAVLNSDAVHMGAYSALYPQISLSFTGTRTYLGPYLAAPVSYSNLYTGQLSLSQLIFDGFATKGNIDQAKAQLNLAFANLDAEKATVSYELKSSFAQLLYAQQLVDLSQKIISVREESARLVKLLYEGGTEDKGAMMLTNANLAQAIYALEQAKRTVVLSSRQLATVLGTDVAQPIRAVGTLRMEDLPPTADFKKLALQTPIYFQHQAEVDAASAGITIANSRWYPTITAGAEVTRTGDFPENRHEWDAGFAVTYPLFEGGRTYFDVKAANAAFREALANLSSGTNQAALTLAQTFKNLVDAVDNVKVQQQLLEAGALRYKIADADYRNGLMSFQDFNTITDTYIGYQQSLLSSQLTAVLAEAMWEEARGQGAIP